MNRGTASENEKTAKDSGPGHIMEHYHLDLIVPKIDNRRILFSIAIEPNTDDREYGPSGTVFKSVI